MPSRTLLDDLSETQAELQRLSGDPNASEVELISAQAQLATIHDLIAKMAPLGTSAGESTDAAARNVAAAEALAAMTLERDAALAQVDILVKERAKLIEQVTFKAREPGAPMADRPPRVPEGKSPVAMSPMTFLAVLRYDIRRRRGADDVAKRIYENQALVHADDHSGLAQLLERDAAGDLTVDGMKVLPWSGAVLGTASFAYKAGP